MATDEPKSSQRQARQKKTPDEVKPKGPRGGARPGAGRPKSMFTRLKEKAIADGLIWYASPEITYMMICHALNGDASLLKHLDERIRGRLGDTPPICVRLDEMQENLPDGFDPEALCAMLQERLIGGATDTPWTRAEANSTGLLAVQGLKKKAMRGDTQAQSFLAKLLPMDPMLTLPEQAQSMTPEQVREVMRQRYLKAWPWHAPEEIDRMVDAVFAGEK